MSPEKQTHVLISTMPLWIPHLVAHAYVQWPVLCCPVFLVDSTLHCRGKNCLFERENSSFLGKKDEIPELVSASLSGSRLGTYYPFSVSPLPHVPHHPLQGPEDNTCKAASLGQSQLMAGSRILILPSPIPNHCHMLFLKEKWAKYFSTSHLNKLFPPIVPWVVYLCQLFYVLGIFRCSLEKLKKNANTFSAWRHSQQDWSLGIQRDICEFSLHGAVLQRRVYTGTREMNVLMFWTVKTWISNDL